jgi:putative nucleotidyltransferase with HDIG domain
LGASWRCWLKLYEPAPDANRVVPKRHRLLLVAQLTLLVSVIAVAVLTSRASDWQPVALVLLLLVLAVGSDLLTMDWRGLRISGSFLAIALSMALLGPAPAAAVGVMVAIVDMAVSPRSWDKSLGNLVNYATFPLIGGLLVDALHGSPTPGAGATTFAFPVTVLVVFMITNLLNFSMVAGFEAVVGGPRFPDSVRLYVTVLPVEVAMALLTAGIALIYQQVGVGAVGLLAVVLFIFQYLLQAGIQAFERGEELLKRTRELASLQVGLINTVMQTLSMRDPMTARHSAAVARYSREVARLLGLSEREQEVIHIAGLFHDIGKFIFPDSILVASRKLTEDEWKTVRLHPEQGAKLVRRIEGYGPVADIVLAHHERPDGSGYPHGISGEMIPLGSRILAAADTYDVMTARDSYRSPVSSQAALEELRRVSGTQLDPMVVDIFVEMIEQHGVAFRHSDEADFERELAFDRRVEDYARPRAVAV